MSNPQHEQIIRNGYAVAEAIDVPGFVNAFTPDGTFTDEAFGNVLPVRRSWRRCSRSSATRSPICTGRFSACTRWMTW